MLSAWLSVEPSGEHPARAMRAGISLPLAQAAVAYPRGFHDCPGSVPRSAIHRYWPQSRLSGLCPARNVVRCRLPLRGRSAGYASASSASIWFLKSGRLGGLAGGVLLALSEK